MSHTISFSVSGLSCAGCVGRAERAIAGVAGISNAAINLATGTAQVEGEDFTAADIAAALDTAGYPARKQQITLSVDEMSCASCAGRVERILRQQPGVLSASVNFAADTAHIEALEGTPASGLARAVTQGGYPARTTGAAHEQSQADRAAKERADLRKQMIVAGVLTLPVFILAMGAHLIPGMHHLIARTIGMQTSWIIQFILTTAVLLGPGMAFFRKGLPALLRGAPEMNSLVAIGTLAAWGYSVLALFAPGFFPGGTADVYFESAAVICTLILLGRYLEARAKGQTGAAIQRLIGMQPKTARVSVNDAVVERPIAEIITGDVLHVRPGERIAVDGTVLSGHSFVDESMITGEPVPVQKESGAVVTAGTINGSGALVFTATAVGDSTLLAQIIRMVQDAQGAKLPIQSLVDQITRVFVPVVMGFAATTVLAWLVFGPDPAMNYALVAGVCVLIIACPCAMGLATPTSIMVGTGRAAELGVLFRKGDALQTLEGVQVIALDKTGTLTEGKPELTTFHVSEDQDADEILGLIASVETQSEHPIAQAIVRAAKRKGVLIDTDVQGFDATVGMGTSARVQGRDIRIGADRFMEQSGIDHGPFAEMGRTIAARAETPLYAAIDGQMVAAIGVSDRVKGSAPQTIQTLQALGLKIAMITGDNKATAAAVAQELGIDEVVAEVLPAGKVDAVRKLRDDFGRIAFVGDGINDAPALAEADVGLAIGNGTDVAIETADAVLVSGDIHGTVAALQISRAVMRNIRQNLFWAFAYNAALIPVAAGVLFVFGGPLLSPMLGAGAMAMSSVLVLGNALRLRKAGTSA